MSHIRRFDHVGITVADLDTVTAFFVGLGLEVEGRMFMEGEFVDTVIGIPGSRSHIVMLRLPEGGPGLELSSFVRPDHEPGSPTAMANELGLRNVWRMAYVRGPEGIIVSLAERLGGRHSTSQPVGASSGADTTGQRPGALQLAGRVDAEFGDQHCSARAVLADPVRDRRPRREQQPNDLGVGLRGDLVDDRHRRPSLGVLAMP